jgi:methionyl-tRNA formyltransferase
VGEIASIGAESLFITAQGGQIEVFKLKHEDGKKISAADFVREYSLVVGSAFGV